MVTMAMEVMDMARGLLSLDIMAMHLVMTTGFRDSMVTMAMARGLLNLDMVDIMARLMSMKTVSMVLMVTMEVMDMVREMLMLSLGIMVMHLVMTTGFRDSMVTMAMVKDLLNQDMVDIMAMLMSMKTVSMVLMVTMEDMVMVKGQLSLGMDMAMPPVMITGSKVFMVIMVTMGTDLILMCFTI